MTDPHPSEDVLDVDSWPKEAEVPAPNRRWLLLLGATAGALVLGAVASTSAMLLSGWRHVPEREFTVAVYLQPDAGAEQRARVERALAALPARDGVRVETRAEAYARFRERWANDPQQLAGVTADTMAESLHLTTVGRDFDCGPVPAIRTMSGVDRVWVLMRPAPGHWGAEVGC